MEGSFDCPVLCVAQDGSGQYCTVQDAIDAVPLCNRQRVVIRVAPGFYRQPIYVPKTKNLITLLGSCAESTILSWGNCATTIDHHKAARVIGTGTFGCGTVIVEGEDFIAQGITFENSSPKGSGQAVAIRVTADRCAFYSCRFLGWQDTAYLHYGRQYFRDCYIEGSVDFIFGNATALLEHCQVHCKSNGYITAQQRKSAAETTGYVFLRCVITGVGSKSPYMYLGRPWAPHARVIFAYTWMDGCVMPVGWNNWNNPDNEKTARFYEYRCSGPGSTLLNRVSWAGHVKDCDVEELLSMSQQDRQRDKPILEGLVSSPKWRAVAALGLGQVVSLLVTTTGFTSSFLAREGVNLPTAQAWCNYALLAIVCGSFVLWKRPKIKVRWYAFLLLAIVDVEANYLVVKAYQYTSITSVMLLDCWSIPCVLFLTWFFLKTRYSIGHFVGVGICVLGLVLVVLSDVHSKDRSGGSNVILGDFLVIAASMLYAISNVSEEFIVKKINPVELLAFLGCFGAVISGVQVMILEWHELRHTEWTIHAVVPFVGFALAQFAFYLLVPILLQGSGSAMFNLSLLTSDMWSVAIRALAYHELVDWIYFIAFGTVAIGLAFYAYFGEPIAKQQSTTTEGDEQELVGPDSEPQGDSKQDLEGGADKNEQRKNSASDTEDNSTQIKGEHRRSGLGKDQQSTTEAEETVHIQLES